MKTKILFTLLLSVFLLNCSTEEASIDVNEANLETSLDKTQEYEGEQNSQRITCLFGGCNINYEAPYLPFNENNDYDLLIINYDEDLSETEVNCKRQEFFECFINLRMNWVQDSNIHIDAWRFPSGRTGKGLGGAINDDPRTTCTVGC